MSYTTEQLQARARDLYDMARACAAQGLNASALALQAHAARVSEDVRRRIMSW